MNSLDRLELLVDDVNSKWRQYQLQRRAQEHGEVNGSGEVKNSGAAKVAAVEGNAAAGGGPGKQLQPPSIIAPDVIGGAILSTPPPATPEQWKDTAAVGTKIVAGAGTGACFLLKKWMDGWKDDTAIARTMHALTPTRHTLLNHARTRTHTRTHMQQYIK